MSELSIMLDNLGLALESAEYSNTQMVPMELQPYIGVLGKGLRGMAAFVRQQQEQRDDTAELWEDMNTRDERAKQIKLGFTEKIAEMAELFGKEREMTRAVVEAQSDTLAEINHKLSMLVKPQDDLVAAYETLELLRSTSSDGAPRELVAVLRRLDVALTGDHVKHTGRKLSLLHRVVDEAEDFLEEAGLDADTTEGLREALANLQEGP